MRWLGIALGILTATPAFAADQFDLICTANKVTVRYRVDLDTQLYCEAGCSQAGKIADITPSTIVFERHEPAFAGDKNFLEKVDRTTGAWTKPYASRGGKTHPTSLTGQCRREHFSGFYPKVF